MEKIKQYKLNDKISIKASHKILPLLVAEYNKYMSSLEFLEEVKEEWQSWFNIYYSQVSINNLFEV